MRQRGNKETIGRTKRTLGNQHFKVSNEYPNRIYKGRRKGRDCKGWWETSGFEQNPYLLSWQLIGEKQVVGGQEWIHSKWVGLEGNPPAKKQGVETLWEEAIFLGVWTLEAHMASTSASVFQKEPQPSFWDTCQQHRFPACQIKTWDSEICISTSSPGVR